jgi:hypothetical protein
MPLSAYYTNKVREAIDIAALVGELVERPDEQQLLHGNEPHGDEGVSVSREEPKEASEGALGDAAKADPHDGA